MERKGVAKDLGSEGETTIKNMNRQSLPQLAGSRCKVDFRDLPSLRQRHLPQVEEAQQFSLRLLQRMLAASDYAKKQAEDVQTSRARQLEGKQWIGLSQSWPWEHLR